MKVNVKLYAGLGEYLPAGSTDHSTLVEAARETTLGQIIERLNVPPGRVHLVLLNGLYVQPADRDTRRLADGDTVALWPPVAGG